MKHITTQAESNNTDKQRKVKNVKAKSETTKFFFSDYKIQKLPQIANDKVRVFYRDEKIKGLYLKITKNNQRFFMVQKRMTINNKSCVVTKSIGQFPYITVDSARAKAIEIFTGMANGIDPNEHKRIIRLATATAANTEAGEASEQQEDELFTLDSMMDAYIERYAKQHTKRWRDSLYNYNFYIKANFPRLCDKEASKISTLELEKAHHKIARKHKSPIMANRAIQLLRAAYNRAENWGYFNETFRNPAAKIQLFKEKSRERFLEKDELRRFFKSLFEEESEDIRDYVFLSLMTGARRSNILAMRWRDINFETKLWKIPGEIMKNGSPLTVPLNDEAIVVLQARKELRTKFMRQHGLKLDYVFFSLTSKSGHLEEPKRGWHRILKRANIEDLRLHDLRRTLGSYQAMNGVTTAVIGKTLGHKSIAATAIYARMNLDPVRDGIQKATNAMFTGSEELVVQYLDGLKKNGSRGIEYVNPGAKEEENMS